MSGEVGNSKRVVSITGGSLRNHHLYISGYYDFFPEECYGESSVRKGTGQKLTLLVDGLPKPVETDIAKSSGNGRPRSFFRKRAWVARFFQRHDLHQGDMVAIERVGRLAYRIYPSGGRTIGYPPSGEPRSSVPSQARLFPDGGGADGGHTGKSGFGDAAFTNNRAEQLHRWVQTIFCRRGNQA